VVVDGHMHVFPTHAAGAVSRIAGHTMAGFEDATQLLDVQMQQVAGMRVFVALNGQTGL
jgi:RNA polymerase-interacting CarD/CdnL/TRCF family regulator